MKNIPRVTLLMLSTIVISACASLTPPERPAYTGSDNISSADAEQLVGTWAVSDLNPYPNAEPQITTIEYRADGSVLGTLIPQGEGSEALGNMQFELTGQWMLDGDTVSHQNITMNSTSDNQLGAIVSKMFNNQKGIAGQANIYELSADRIVMVGSDGAAMEYIRQ